jgi:hypothetical protein
VLEDIGKISSVIDVAVVHGFRPFLRETRS